MPTPQPYNTPVPYTAPEGYKWDWNDFAGWVLKPASAQSGPSLGGGGGGGTPASASEQVAASPDYGGLFGGYLDELRRQQAERQSRYDALTAAFKESEDAIYRQKEADLADLEGIANDETITKRAADYKQSYLDQALPEFKRMDKSSSRDLRQRAAQRGWGDSSIYDYAEGERRRTSSDALSKLEGQAFQLGADKETSERGFLANLRNSIIAAREADLSRLLSRRSLALQELGQGGGFDTSLASLSLDSAAKSAALAQAAREFSANNDYRWAMSDQDWYKTLLGFQLAMAPYGASLQGNVFGAPSVYGSLPAYSG